MYKVKFEKILLSIFCLFLFTNFLFSYQGKDENPKTQKQNVIKEEKKSSIGEITRTPVSDNKEAFQIKSYQEDIISVVHTVIDLNLLLIVIIMLFIAIAIKKGLQELLNHVELIAKRTGEQFSDIISKLDTIQKNFTKIIESMRSVEKKNSIIEGTLYQEQVGIKAKEIELSESIYESEVINVKFAGEHDSKLILLRDNVAEYFYIEKHGGTWQLYVVDNILSRRPSQEYEAVLSKFFDIEKTGDPHHYELIEGALIDWDESSNKGYLKHKGKIKQI